MSMRLQIQPPRLRSVSRQRADRHPGRRFAACAFLIMLTWSGPVVYGQQAADVSFADRVSVEWVSVSVIVESKNRVLPPLAPGMFRLFVDDREVKIDEFDAAGEIVNLLYLQDVSGSMDLRSRLGLSRSAYRQMVKKLIPGDHLALATFASPQVEVKQPFTADHQLLAGLEQAWVGYGETALIDATAAIPQLSHGHWGRTTGLVVTDGVDTASELPIGQVRTLLSGTGIPVYVFGLEGGAPDQRDATNKNRKPGAAAKERPADGFATEVELQGLRELAEASGGRYVNLTEISVELAVSRVLRDIRNRVFLGFPTETSTTRSMHTVEVRLLHKRGIVHHRTHYFGFDPQGW